MRRGDAGDALLPACELVPGARPLLKERCGWLDGPGVENEKPRALLHRGFGRNRLGTASRTCIQSQCVSGVKRFLPPYASASPEGPSPRSDHPSNPKAPPHFPTLPEWPFAASLMQPQGGYCARCLCAHFLERKALRHQSDTYTYRQERSRAGDSARPTSPTTRREKAGTGCPFVWRWPCAGDTPKEDL